MCIRDRNSYVLYQLTGHGEASLESDFTETLDNSGVTMQDLNLLTTVTLAAHCPKLVAPAMNTHMLENPITQDLSLIHISRRRQCGFIERPMVPIPQ